MRLIRPSAAHEEWARTAIPQLRAEWHQPAIAEPVTVAASFYRDRQVGALVNYMQALADALEKGAHHHQPLTDRELGRNADV